MMKFYLSVTRCIAFFLLLLTTTAWSQSKAVTGSIKSSEDGSPLPGVSILEKGTNNGTVTDANGNFSISVGDQATLLLTFIGYKNQEVNVGPEGQINISMEPEITELSEIVVIGYGTAQRKDLTGSVSQVSSKDFNAGINPNPLQAIQGKVAGLTITQPSGDPNQAPNVRLRGYTSLSGGSEPLYVVDGVIGVPINTISPSDIEQIDVLKDASASAIYGSRAANGVIMITTKRGKDGKAGVSYNSYVGVESISHGLDMLNGDEYRAEVVRVKGASALDDTFRFPTDASGNPYSTDWLGEITRQAITHSHDIAISGGSPTLSYRGSLDYTKREGIITNTGFQRVTGRINLDQKSLNNKLNIQYNLSITDNKAENANNIILTRALFYLPTLPVRAETGEYYEVEGAYDLYNPVAMQESYQDDMQTRTLIGSMNIKY